MMKKIHFLLLISLLLAACSDDDKEKQPAFVTNITISDAGKTFNPGDAVTVKADGLQSGDQIILDIYWPIADNPLFPEGYSRYTRAVTTEQTTNSITFLAPGHWPASRVEMFLERAGQLQPLGQISVADGQSPEEPYLYGITNSHAIYTPTVPRGITRIDLVTQEISEVIQFHDDEDFHLAANIPGTNILCGIREKDGSSFIDGYDLCMHYWCNPVERNAITICSDFNNTVSLEMAGDKLLTYCSISYPVYTRLNMPPIHTPEIPLPDGLKPESLSRYPGVIADVHMLLSANNGDDTFSPVVVDIAKEKMHCYDPIKAEALIPFRIMEPSPENPNSLQCKGGYIVSRANGGDTQFCLWDTTAGNLKAQAYTNTVPAEVRRLEKESDYLQWEAMLKSPLDRSRMMVRDGMVYYLPECFDQSWKLRYLRTGLLLGEWKKNRFEPSQAVAMVLQLREFSQSLSLTAIDERSIRYLKGETIFPDPEETLQKGWVLVGVDGYPLGWAKYTGSSLKNKYYPGWRWQ